MLEAASRDQRSIAVDDLYKIIIASTATLAAMQIELLQSVQYMQPNFPRSKAMLYFRKEHWLEQPDLAQLNPKLLCPKSQEIFGSHKKATLAKNSSKTKPLKTGF